MVAYIKYRYKLAKMERKKESLSAQYDDEMRRAKREGKLADDIQLLEHDFRFDQDILNEEISIFMTNYLVNKGRKKFISIPSREESEMWKKCNIMSNQYMLTDAGISKIRFALRLEQKERNEAIIPYLAATTGVIGAITGLLSILKK